MIVGTSDLRRLMVAMALAVAPSSCAHHGGGTAATPQGSDLSGTTWHIEDVGGNPVADASQTALRFGQDGRVSGSTGCNNFTGKATVSATGLTFSPLATTRKACTEPLAGQEVGILAAFKSVKSSMLADDGQLNLLDAAGQVALRLSRANP